MKDKEKIYAHDAHSDIYGAVFHQNDVIAAFNEIVESIMHVTDPDVPVEFIMSVAKSFETQEETEKRWRKNKNGN